MVVVVVGRRGVLVVVVVVLAVVLAVVVLVVVAVVVVVVLVVVAVVVDPMGRCAPKAVGENAGFEEDRLLSNM